MRRRGRLFAAGILAAGLDSATAVRGQAPQTADDMHRLHGDPAAYIAALEDPQRDVYQKPNEVVAALALKPGEIIADIGAGSGYFALRLAPHVGANGHVYAVDVSPDMIRRMNQRIREAKLFNVSTILAAPDDPLLPRPVNRFLFVNVWHHIHDRPAYLGLMKRLLEPGGQIVMIDFHKKELPVGPPAAMKIAREDLIAEMKKGGFTIAREHTMLPYQYFLIFQAQE